MNLRCRFYLFTLKNHSWTKQNWKQQFEKSGVCYGSLFLLCFGCQRKHLSKDINRWNLEFSWYVLSLFTDQTRANLMLYNMHKPDTVTVSQATIQINWGQLMGPSNFLRYYRKLVSHWALTLREEILNLLDNLECDDWNQSHGIALYQYLKRWVCFCRVDLDLLREPYNRDVSGSYWFNISDGNCTRILRYWRRYLRHSRQVPVRFRRRDEF